LTATGSALYLRKRFGLRPWAGRLFGLPFILRRQQIEPVLQLAAVQPGERVLDLGSASGFYAAETAVRGATSLAVDINSASLRGLIDHRFHGSGLQPIVADATAMPLREASIDAVIVSGTLQSTSPDRLLAECARVLKMNGRIIIVAAGEQRFVRRVYDAARRSSVMRLFLRVCGAPKTWSDFTELYRTRKGINEYVDSGSLASRASRHDLQLCRSMYSPTGGSAMACELFTIVGWRLSERTLSRRWVFPLQLVAASLASYWNSSSEGGSELVAELRRRPGV
jgi:ubiquinone/menaquinone biosynthesis C-methylase UbiE